VTTPEQHNKYLAIAHIVHGGLYALMMIAMLAMLGFFIFIEIEDSNAKGAPPPVILIIFFVAIVFFYLLLVVPSFLAGYALLKRKRWAKIAALIGGVVSAMSFPLGTAVCVYTFWFLFSEPGKLLYDTTATSRPLEVDHEPDMRYMSGSTPPNWR
jgi:hypothetical protein